MPMTLEERKAEIDQLVDRMASHYSQIGELQREIAGKLQAAADSHGAAVLLLLQDAIGKMLAAPLLAMPDKSPFKM
jgi:hypothetical protein